MTQKKTDKLLPKHCLTSFKIAKSMQSQCFVFFLNFKIGQSQTVPLLCVPMSWNPNPGNAQICKC